MITGAVRAGLDVAAAVVAGSWSAAGELPRAGWLATDTAVLLNDGRVLLAGGEDAARNAFGEATVYDPAINAWKPTGNLTTSRRLHTLTRLADGRVLATGGIGGPIALPLNVLASAEIYDPSTGAWTPTGSMGQARYYHSATLLPDGRVLVAGGDSVRTGGSGRSLSYRTLNSAELFDPETGTWTRTGSMTEARAAHPAVSLPDGRVLVAGGWITVTVDEAVGMAHCETYDPASGTWRPTGNLISPRVGAAAVPLPDGSVLLTGGGPGLFRDYNTDSLSSTERYDPATGLWNAAADMPWAMSFHRAVPLPSGKVLVTGGSDAGFAEVGFRATLIYDPAARTWGITGGLSAGRWYTAAVALADGRVLAAGGFTLGPSATASGEYETTNTAEIFTP